MTTLSLRRLYRIRWAVRATLAFGVAASVAANVLHANHNPISQSISAWPPLALLLTVELVSRVPVHRKSLTALRMAATAVIAGIAGWVSYWHMAGVASRYGETDASPYLLPVSVDGLIVVASICLVELAGRIRDHETPARAASTVLIPAQPSGPVVPAQVEQLQPVSTAAPVDPDTADDGDDQAVTDELLHRARQVVAEHRRRTGRDITRDQLRAALRVQNATAGELLRLIRTETPHTTPGIAAPTRGNGRPTLTGELTR